MKPGSKHRRLAGILAVAALTPACTASPSAAFRPACTTLPIASASAAGASGQRSALDLPSVPGGLADVAARSSRSALAVGSTVPTPAHQRALVALWNGAVWRTLSSRALPQGSFLGRVALFPGGAWAAGDYGMVEGGRESRPLMVQVTGTTVRQVQVPGLPEWSSLADVAATSAADAWAGGSNFGTPLIFHWNGTAWKRAPLPAAVRSGLFTGVAAASRTSAWAVIDPEGGWGRPRIVHWNGRRWGDVVSPAIGMSYRLNGVAATSARNAWAVGSTGSSRAVILHWNGLRWTCALSPKGHGYYPRILVAVSASSADNAWAVGGAAGGAGTGTLALHWNGHTWTQVITPQPGQVSFLAGVAIIPPSGRDAWAVGNADHGTLMLHWNGTAWH